MTGALAEEYGVAELDRTRTRTIVESATTPTTCATDVQRALIEARWPRDTYARLTELLALKPGWDGYNAAPLTRDAALLVLQFLTQNAPTSIAAPAIFPIHGGAQLEWETIGIRVEIELRPAGSWLEMTDDDGEVSGALDELRPRLCRALVRVTAEQ